MGDNEWRRLSPLEETILRQLLAPDFPGKEQLECQTADALVATIDEDGSLKFRGGNGPPASEVKYRVPTEARFQDSDGVGVHVLLHVVGDYVDELEVFKEDASRVRDWSGANAMDVFAPD